MGEHVFVPGELDPKEEAELKERLSNPVRLDAGLIAELRGYCLHHPDPAVQVAAIIGLERLATKRAVLILTERVLQGGALHPTERAMEALIELANKGGLLALTATLFSDCRSIHRKLVLLFYGAKKQYREDVAQSIETIYQLAGTRCDIREIVPEILDSLEHVALPDISAGTILARSSCSTPMWARNTTAPESETVERAIVYSNSRLAGIIEILKVDRNSLYRNHSGSPT